MTTYEITQSDREALANYYAIPGVGGYKNRIAEEVREGRYEDPLLRAFAAHRRHAHDQGYYEGYTASLEQNK